MSVHNTPPRSGDMRLRAAAASLLRAAVDAIDKQFSPAYAMKNLHVLAP